MKKVVIVDEQPIIRLSVRTLLQQEGFDVVAEAANGVEVLNAVKEHQPDLVILDMEISLLDPITVINLIKAMPLPPNVVVFTARDSRHLPMQCVQAGAHGYVHKTAEVQDLVKALRAAQFGYTFLPSSAFDHDEYRNESELVAGLSPRELQVLQHLTEGKRNFEIAQALQLHSKTISTYKMRLLAKFEVNSLVDLVLIAQRNGNIRSF